MANLDNYSYKKYYNLPSSITSCNESTTAWLSSGISLGTPGGGIDIVSNVSPVGSGLSLEFTLEPGK